MVQEKPKQIMKFRLQKLSRIYVSYHSTCHMSPTSVSRRVTEPRRFPSYLSSSCWSHDLIESCRPSVFFFSLFHLPESQKSHFYVRSLQIRKPDFSFKKFLSMRYYRQMPGITRNQDSHKTLCSLCGCFFK